uniref:K Homology domain-containing protein n=2 Tax=Aegilops tauschii subsp. strangulata TaxID=200361 RepID=A0A453TED9_AEGTS
MRSPVNKDAQEESVTIAVADEHMGAVIGRGGRIINEISKCPEILFLDQLVSLEVLRTS